MSLGMGNAWKGDIVFFNGKGYVRRGGVYSNEDAEVQVQKWKAKGYLVRRVKHKRTNVKPLVIEIFTRNKELKK